MSSKLGTITIMGEEVTVDADVNGRFWLYIERPPEEEGGRVKQDNLANADSLEAAKRKARVELAKRRVEVAVPFVTRDGRRGIGIKRNLSTGGVIVEIEGERDEIGRGFRVSRQTFKEGTPAAVTSRLAELHEIINTASDEQRKLEDEWMMDLGSRLDQVIAETAAARDTAGAAA